MNRAIIMLLIFCAIGKADPAQIKTHVHWSYGIKKTSNGLVEVHLRAKIDKGWHIYAQAQLPEAVAIPTSIAFNKTSGFTLIGKIQELGKKDVYHDKNAGITNYEYAYNVDFVQKIKVSSTKPILLKGTISYQTCTHQQCLPENTIDFNIPLK